MASFSTLFEKNQIIIEDVIFQILVECCRYAYLSSSEKHPITFYIERDELELEPERKTIKRIIDYVNEKYDIEERRIKDSLNEQVLKPKDTEPVKTKNNRYPEYQLSEFAYWELKNIHDMDIVIWSFFERRIIRALLSMKNWGNAFGIRLRIFHRAIVTGTFTEETCCKTVIRIGIYSIGQ